MNFGTVPWNKGGTATIALNGTDVEDVEILDMELTGSADHAVVFERLVGEIVDERDQPDGKLSVRFRLLDGAPLGAFTGWWKLLLDHPEVPELRLRVMGRVQGPIDYRPPRVVFADMDETPEFNETREIEVFEVAGKPLQILSVESLHQSLTVSVKQQDGGKALIEVTCDGSFGDDRARGILRVHTDHETFPLLEVPVEMVRMMEIRQPSKPKAEAGADGEEG